MPAAIHPSPEQLAAFFAGKLSPADHAAVESHILQCNECCLLLRQQGDDSLVRLARAADSPETPGVVPADNHTLAAPQHGPAPDGPLAGVPADLVDHPRYRVVAFLGAGGMGEVFKAEHRMMQRTVALKVINRQMVSDPDAVARFLREVRAAAKLQHANIVSAYDAEQAGDLHFLVMEFVDGVNLATLIARKGPLPIRQAAHFTRQAALGLQAAFEQGMVHRDIKPHNLMVTRKGQVKILDFGLARLAWQTDNPAGSVAGNTAGLTGASVIMGTPDFLAPEQARDSRKVDHRADIYSLGCTLYFLLTGNVPFPEGTVIEKFFKHWEEEPRPITDGRADLPEELVAIVMKMMAKRPDDRYQTPAEVAAALAPLAQGVTSVSGATAKAVPVVPLAPVAPMVLPDPPDVPAEPVRTSSETSPTRRRKRRRKPAGVPWVRVAAIAAGCLAALAVLGAVLWQFLPRSTPTPLAGSPTSPSSVTPPANRTPRVLMVMPPRFWAPDFGPVMDGLREAGVSVDIAGKDRNPVEAHPDSLRGGPPQGVPPVHVTRVLDGSLRGDDYDAILFMSGEVWEFNNNSPAAQNVHSLIDEAKGRKWIGGICTGVNLLMDHDALRGKQASGGGMVKEPRGGATLVQQAVVVTDTKIITTGNFQDAWRFRDEVLRQLGKPPGRPDGRPRPGGLGGPPPLPPDGERP